MNRTSSDAIPLAEPDLRGAEAAYLARCVADNWVSSAGPFVADFERRIAALAGRAHGVAAASGTAALHLLLVAAGVKPGDRVVVPDYTFAATANAVLHAGAVPFFVDVREATWTLDPALLEEALAGSDIAAVIAVHTLGHPADMDALAALCRAKGALLFEDAAGAIGATYRGRPAGGLGDAAMFSFNGNKTVTAGGGGMIVTDRADWAARAKALSQQSRPGSRYRYDAVGFNYRMTNVNAAIGLAQLERLGEMLAAKRRIAARYDAALTRRRDLSPMPRAAWADSGCWLYSVLCGTPSDADALVAMLHAEGIAARHFWEALSAQPPYAGAPRRLNGVARRLTGRVVSLPCSSHLTEAQQSRVLSAIERWRGGDIRDAA
jgi:dTDP-4-amino-4,6-dideoxygalactose transaminase